MGRASIPAKYPYVHRSVRDNRGPYGESPASLAAVLVGPLVLLVEPLLTRTSVLPLHRKVL